MLTNIKPLRVDSALRALSTLRGLRGAPKVPPLCRETQSLGQQMFMLHNKNTTKKNHNKRALKVITKRVKFSFINKLLTKTREKGKKNTIKL